MSDHNDELKALTAQVSRVAGEMQKLRGEMEEVKEALIGTMDGREGLVHKTKELERAVFDRKRGTMVRVESLEESRTIGRAYLAALVMGGSAVGGVIGWMLQMLW